MDLSFETLPDDLVFDIFERLPTNHLYLVAETCSRFFDLAGIAYRRRYPDKYVCISLADDRIVLQPYDHDVQIFGRKFLNLIVRSHGRNVHLDEKLLLFILVHCSVNLQMLRFEEVMLNVDQLAAMQHMLNRIEKLVLHKCGLNNDFYDTILRHCPRLKHLIVSDSHTIVETTESKWLYQKYPTLETVQLCSITIVSFCSSQWSTFFLQNPQITSFSCDHWYLTDATDRPIKVISRNAKKLKRLYISLRGIGHLNNTYSDLFDLCQKKQFERLEIQLTGTAGIQYLMRHKKILAEMGKLNTLHLTDVALDNDAATAIATLVNLKELNFINAVFNSEVGEMLSMKLNNLEKVYCDAVANDFTPFARYSPKLNEIILENTEMGGLNLGWGPHWLSDERQKIPDVCPITFYVKTTNVGGTEMSAVSCGIVTIKCVEPNKSVLLKVENTFIA